MLTAVRHPVIYRPSSLRIKDMETEKLALKREKLLRTLIEEEIDYQHDYRAFWLESIWFMAENLGYITKEELQRKLPCPAFGKEEIEQISEGLRARHVVIFEKKPSKEEVKKIKPLITFRTMGILRPGVRYEHEFVASFATSRFSKVLSKVLEELDNREFSRDVEHMFSSSFIPESGFDKDTFLRAKGFRKDLELIRQEILYLKKTVKWMFEDTDDVYKGAKPKLDALYARRIDHNKLICLWDIASKHGFITHEVIKELAPEHVIKANQTDQIASFFTELGIHVCDKVPNDEELLKLPEPHISGDTIHIVTEGAFQGTYGMDEWKFLNTFTSEEAKKDYLCSLSIDSFTLDMRMELFQISTKLKEEK